MSIINRFCSFQTTPPAEIENSCAICRETVAEHPDQTAIVAHSLTTEQKTHHIHLECLTEWVQECNRQNHPAFCPLCNRTIVLIDQEPILFAQHSLELACTEAMQSYDEASVLEMLPLLSAESLNKILLKAIDDNLPHFIELLLNHGAQISTDVLIQGLRNPKTDLELLQLLLKHSQPISEETRVQLVQILLDKEGDHLQSLLVENLGPISQETQIQLFNNTIVSGHSSRLTSLLNCFQEIPKEVIRKAIVEAAGRGDKECLRILLTTSFREEDWKAAFLEALVNDHSDCCHLLLEKNIHIAEQLRTVFVSALDDTSLVPCLEILMAEGVQISEDDWEKLIEIALTHNNTDSLRFLLSIPKLYEGDKQAKIQREALLSATRLGHTECLEVLLLKGVSEADWGSALVEAIVNGKLGCVKRLLEYKTRLAEAIKTIGVSLEDENSLTQCLELLLKEGVQISEPARALALQLAVKKNYLHCLQILASDSSQISEEDWRVALGFALDKDNLESLLVLERVRPYLTDRTKLSVEDVKEIVQEMVEHDTVRCLEFFVTQTPFFTDELRETSIQIAIKRGSVKCLELLRPNPPPALEERPNAPQAAEEIRQNLEIPQEVRVEEISSKKGLMSLLHGVIVISSAMFLAAYYYSSKSDEEAGINRL